jgi:16S rRNA processing protein RimM
MDVVSESGELLGKIAEIIPMPANDIWRVDGQREILLPATENVILEVDTAKRRVTIRLLEGLIEA